MLRWAIRFFLLRVLPGRLILFMSLADLFFLLRSIRRRMAQPIGLNDPRRQRTGPPGPEPRRVSPPAPPTRR